MRSQLFCPDEARRARVRAEGRINGIDYLQVLDAEAPAGTPRQQTLLVHCFLPLTASPPVLTRDNVRIEGGVRVRSVGVLWAYPAPLVPAALLTSEGPLQSYLASLADAARVFVVRTDRTGDFSTYTLRLIRSPDAADQAPPDFDPLLAAVDFSFKVDCPSDFDCAAHEICPEPVQAAPQINYLAKDYASFRRLMLDRMAVTMPDWKERSPADLGIALVETLAYAADHLSYYQDAVATEAYLGTARRRPSIRRHARLMDYFVHDGSNARVWIAIEVQAGSSADGFTLPTGTQVTSEGAQGASGRQAAQTTSTVVFETLHDLKLLAERSEIPFYSWGDPNCCLPKGATRATLAGSDAALQFRKADVLIFEEVLGPQSGRSVDADPSHRHVVRLNADPEERTDPVTSETVLEISWHHEDALPFPLCLKQFNDAAGRLRGASVARGNVVLADHGETIRNEPLTPEEVPRGRPYRPVLRRTGITHAMVYDDQETRKRPAGAVTRLDLRRVKPQVRLQTPGDFQQWHPQRDLLSSDRFAPEFVVELESDGRAYLRFGDGVLGLRPAAGSRFAATYRVGNGSAGNVGADTLTRLGSPVDGIIRVRNPIPAVGGTDAEPIEQVRLFAPQAFRTQERAVTDADYAVAAQRHTDVQRAAATRRWTGSWYTLFVTVDRKGGRPVDAVFEDDLRNFLERFRLAGYDLEIDAPHFVSLDIVLTVFVAPGFDRSQVKEALLETFSNRDLPDGRRGFFRPDNFTFGQAVYLSQLVASAMGVPGVAWVDVDDTPPKINRFRRWGQESRDELAAGRITLERLEIARLDNDPNAPENGRIEFFMEGGL